MILPLRQIPESCSRMDPSHQATVSSEEFCVDSKHTKSDLSKLYKFNIRWKGLAANQEMSAFNISLKYLHRNFFVFLSRMSFTAVSRK